LKEWKQSLAKLEAEQKNWKNKVDQIENLREKNKKDNANLIAKWEKALEAAKKKYDAKKKHFEGIDVEIKSREALIADCQKVMHFVSKLTLNGNLCQQLTIVDFNSAC
jgi:CRISPR/Cas system CSM-associated protein Csm4 (group 5 of RAMP superfamily)